MVCSPFFERPARNAPPSEETGEPVFRAYNYIANLEQTMCAPFGMALLRNWNTVIQNYNNVRVVYELLRASVHVTTLRARQGPLDVRRCDGLFSADVLHVCIRARSIYDIRYQKDAPLGGKTLTDNIHPSAITQYTNACIMYAVLTGKTPVGLTNNGGLNQLNHTVLQVKMPPLF